MMSMDPAILWLGLVILLLVIEIRSEERRVGKECL